MAHPQADPYTDLHHLKGRNLGLSSGGEVLARGSRLALVVSTPEGPGAAIAVDGRGRMFVPVWLRQTAGSSRQLLVGTNVTQALVVVAAVGVLDGIGDLLAGGLR